MQRSKTKYPPFKLDKTINTVFLGVEHLLNRKKELLITNYYTIKNISISCFPTWVIKRLKINFYAHCKVVFQYADQTVLIIYNKPVLSAVEL